MQTIKLGSIQSLFNDSESTLRKKGHIMFEPF